MATRRWKKLKILVRFSSFRQNTRRWQTVRRTPHDGRPRWCIASRGTKRVTQNVGNEVVRLFTRPRVNRPVGVVTVWVRVQPGVRTLWSLPVHRLPRQVAADCRRPRLHPQRQRPQRRRGGRRISQAGTYRSVTVRGRGPPTGRGRGSDPRLVWTISRKKGRILWRGLSGDGRQYCPAGKLLAVGTGWWVQDSVTSSQTVSATKKVNYNGEKQSNKSKTNGDDGVNSQSLAVLWNTTHNTTVGARHAELFSYLRLKRKRKLLPLVSRER